MVQVRVALGRGGQRAEEAPMMKAGLLAACLGAVLLAFSSFRGVVTGFVGTTVWPHPGWRLANLVGGSS